MWEVQLQASWRDFGLYAESLPGHHSPLRAHSHWTAWTAGRRSSWSRADSGGGSGLLCVHSLHLSATYLQRDSQKSAGVWSHVFPCTSLSLYISLPTSPVVYPCCCSLFAKVVSLGSSPPEPPRNSSTCTRPKLPIPCQTHVQKYNETNIMDPIIAAQIWTGGSYLHRVHKYEGICYLSGGDNAPSWKRPDSECREELLQCAESTSPLQRRVCRC